MMVCIAILSPPFYPFQPHAAQFTLFSNLLCHQSDSDTSDDAEFDPNVLHALQKSGGRALQFMPDNGENGEAEVYRVQNFELVPVEPEMKGIFFGGDSYVVKYEYQNKRGGHGFVIYNWQVQD